MRTIAACVTLCIAACSQAHDPANPELGTTRQLLYPAVPAVPPAPILPGGPLVSLTPATAAAFVAWTGALPAAEGQRAVDEIALHRTDEAVLDALVAVLNGPVVDPARHMVTALIVGQLGNPRAADALDSYIRRTHTNPTTPPHHGFSTHEYEEMIDCAAIRAMASLKTTNALAHTLYHAGHHAGAVARLCAIQYYSFYRDDSPDAIAQLTANVQPAEQIYIGLPRYTELTLPSDLDDAVEARFAAHPELAGPPPLNAWRSDSYTATGAGPTDYSPPEQL